MKLPSSFARLKEFRFPREVIAYAVWAYHRFGGHFANCIRRDQPTPNDKWHMDEVVITIEAKKFWLWCAIDADGDVLDILVQPRRNKKAAGRFFSRLVKQYGEPRVVVTDKLGSYVKPIETLAPDVDQSWSQEFGPCGKVDRLNRKTIRNDEEKTLLCRLQGQGCA